jgi:hypothetical protein
MPLEVVVLAAGQGKRMRSALPKVLHPLGGRPLLAHVLEAARSLGARRPTVVHGHGAEAVRAAFSATDVQWVLQAEQLGTGHVNVDVLPLHLGYRGRWWLALASIVMSLAFCVVLAVLTSRLWLEAWEQRWVSDTMWRARLWIPYSSMPIGLGILVAQYIADLYSLLAGREPPFGIKA